MNLKFVSFGDYDSTPIKIYVQLMFICEIYGKPEAFWMWLVTVTCRAPLQTFC